MELEVSFDDQHHDRQFAEGILEAHFNTDQLLIDHAQVENRESTKPRRQRTKWTDEETNDLLQGCNLYGVGNWKKILQDTRFQFNNRSPIDLKDRFRTIFPEDYRRLYPNAKTHTDRAQKIQTNGGFPKVQRKERRAFTTEEDARLLEGFLLHGPSWSKIQRDANLGFSARRSTDLRDRFRNAFPDRYAAAGFKSRPPKSSRSEGSRSAPLERDISQTSELTLPSLDSAAWQQIGDLQHSLQSNIFDHPPHSHEPTQNQLPMESSLHEAFASGALGSFAGAENLFSAAEVESNGQVKTMTEDATADLLWHGMPWNIRA